MKFSKSSLILLGLGIAAFGATMISMVYSQQAAQQQSLQQQLLTTQQKLSQVKIDDLTAQKEQLTHDKDLYTAQIAEARIKLTDPIDDIGATDMILQSAHEFEIQILAINSEGKAVNTLTGNKFEALPFHIQVAGSTEHIADFVSNINTLFPTSVVQNYQLGIDNITPSATPATPTLSEDIEDTTAKIDIIIYDYLGDANVDR